MEVKIKQGNEMLDATIEMVEGVMVVSPKGVKEIDVTKFKDGDIITCGWNTGDKSYSWVSIQRGEIERITDNLLIADYCTLNCDGTFSLENGDSNSATYVRYATEEEKKKLFDKIEAEGYEWIADGKKLVKKKWEPKEGEWCYSPIVYTTSFKTNYAPFRGEIGMNFYNKGWVFRTEEECQAFCDKLNEAIVQIKP